MTIICNHAFHCNELLLNKPHVLNTTKVLLLVKSLFVDCAGNYWAIHPACVDDFAHGDYRRRQARRRVRRRQQLYIIITWWNTRWSMLSYHVTTHNDDTEFVPMSCVTGFTRYNTSLTPTDIVAMLPVSRDLTTYCASLVQQQQLDDRRDSGSSDH